MPEESCFSCLLETISGLGRTCRIVASPVAEGPLPPVRTGTETTEEWAGLLICSPDSLIERLSL